MRKGFVAGILLMAITVFCGCSTFEEMRLSRHEANASDAYLTTTPSKLAPIVEKVLAEQKYLTHKVEDSEMAGHYTGSDIEVTFREVGDGKTVLFVRIDSMGDPAGEKKIIDAVREKLNKK
jgi:hypothetical protein